MKGNRGWPDVYVVGAPKCGTTSLHRYLQMHPHLTVSTQKELHYFSAPWLRRNANGPGDIYQLRRIVDNEDVYLRSFAPASWSKHIIDVSPSYLYYAEQVIPAIRARSPNAKIIVLVRDPVERAYSQYLHMLRDLREWLDFGAAVEVEDERIRAGWSDMWRYVDSSLLAQKIKLYRSHFGSDRVRVISSESLRQSPELVMRNLWTFLEVEDMNFRRIELNRTGVVRSPFVARLLARGSPMKSAIRPFIPAQLRRAIVFKLQGLNSGARPDMNFDTREMLEQRLQSEKEAIEAILGTTLYGDAVG